MSTRSRKLISDRPRFKTANEEWKARWDDLLAGSIMFAVAAHAAAFAFLASDEASQIHGAVLSVDAGLTAG